MQADPGTTYGRPGGPQEVDAVGHNHLPDAGRAEDDRRRVQRRLNPDGRRHRALRRRVSDRYHGLGATFTSTRGRRVPGADPALARGGEVIAEVPCDASVDGCQFPGFPGTVSWKIGYQVYRDAPVGDDGPELSAAAMDACEARAANEPLPAPIRSGAPELLPLRALRALARQAEGTVPHGHAGRASHLPRHQSGLPRALDGVRRQRPAGRRLDGDARRLGQRVRRRGLRPGVDDDARARSQPVARARRRRRCR